MIIKKEEKKELLNEVYSKVKKLNKKCVDVSTMISQLIENGYVTGKVLSEYDVIKDFQKKLNDNYLGDIEKSFNLEDDSYFIDEYTNFCLWLNKFQVSLNNLECFSLKLFMEYSKITRTVIEIKSYLDKIDDLLDNIYKQHYIFSFDSSYLVFKDKFYILNKRYLKWIEIYNQKYLLIMLEKNSDIVLDYYNILCEIYGCVRCLLEDDLYYYCRDNYLKYKM